MQSHKLSGTLPSELALFAGPSGLQELYLNGNSFSGTIPSELNLLVDNGAAREAHRQLIRTRRRKRTQRPEDRLNTHHQLNDDKYRETFGRDIEFNYCWLCWNSNTFNTLLHLGP